MSERLTLFVFESGDPPVVLIYEDLDDARELLEARTSPPSTKRSYRRGRLSQLQRPKVCSPNFDLLIISILSSYGPCHDARWDLGT